MKPATGRRQDSSDREVLAGLVERVTFHSPENGFCVLRTRVRGHRDLVMVVGHAAMVAPGEWITASGEWVNNRTRLPSTDDDYRSSVGAYIRPSRWRQPPERSFVSAGFAGAMVVRWW